MSELIDIPEGPLRHGYTTGACATACTKAALLALLSQRAVDEVEIVLPRGERVRFELVSCSYTQSQAICTTRKDAGDDPDVTHGAVIGAAVELNEQAVIRFLKGTGVGTVTLPGLEIPVGEPAINPVPRQMIVSACRKVLADYGQEQCGVDVTVFVPDGRKIAKRTLNERLGILDGISILGTTGIVTPFSAASYIASIQQGIDVAVANGCREIVINSGARSENYLKSLFSSLPPFAFIHYGNWIAETMEKIAGSRLERVNMGMMLGKAVKVAAGMLDTHSARGSWDSAFIARLAGSAGYPGKVLESVDRLQMAGRLTELFPFSAQEPFYQALLRACHQTCQRLIPGVQLTVFLINKDGEFIKFNNEHN